ncbi:MAG TPA: InlB B-repeat-containing protein [Clostridia bacterium]
MNCKRLFLISLFILIFLSACSGNTVKICFYLSQNETIVISKEQIIELPQPQKDGYIFEGWFLDRQFQNPFYLADLKKINKTVTLYPKWALINNGNQRTGNEEHTNNDYADDTSNSDDEKTEDSETGEEDRKDGNIDDGNDKQPGNIDNGGIGETGSGDSGQDDSKPIDEDSSENDDQDQSGGEGENDNEQIGDNEQTENSDDGDDDGTEERESGDGNDDEQGNGDQSDESSIESDNAFRNTFKFEEVEGEIHITGLNPIFFGNKIIIPEKYENKLITKITNLAFFSPIEIQEVEILPRTNALIFEQMAFPQHSTVWFYVNCAEEYLIFESIPYIEKTGSLWWVFF